MILQEIFCTQTWIYLKAFTDAKISPFFGENGVIRLRITKWTFLLWIISCRYFFSIPFPTTVSFSENIVCVSMQSFTIMICKLKLKPFLIVMYVCLFAVGRTNHQRPIIMPHHCQWHKPGEHGERKPKKATAAGIQRHTDPGNSHLGEARPGCLGRTVRRPSMNNR